MNLGLKAAVQGLSNRVKALLIFAVAVIPPVLVLLQEQSTNPFLYGAAILGGVLAFAVKMLSDPEY
jgi:hypothetical protein